MDYSVFNKKVRLITFSLIIPLQVDLQASVENHEASTTQPPRKSIKTVQSLQERSALVYSTARDTLTPKEIQIANLARCRFLQLQNNNRACKSPSIGLWILTEIAQQIHDDAIVRGRPVSLVYNKLEQIATQFCPNDRNPLTVSVDPSLVQQIAQVINKPILYIEVGNKGWSYGPGALDIAGRLIFARLNELENNDERDLENDLDNENEEVLVQHAWFRDHELLNTISTYGLNSVVICYNSYLGRTIFSIPRNQNFTPAKESDVQTPLWQKTAILSIGKKRKIRNVGIFATAAASIYALKTFLWPVIISSQVAHYVMGLINSQTSVPVPPPIQTSVPEPLPVPSPSVPPPVQTSVPDPLPVPSPSASTPAQTSVPEPPPAPSPSVPPPVQTPIPE
ncbi:MAG: hypothetical protein LBF34_03145 [Puniceicoccales bacterium]|jgi:hypothetical protein|nr:hypothetical protein [Puniceicoccales bacterium]